MKILSIVDFVLILICLPFFHKDKSSIFDKYLSELYSKASAYNKNSSKSFTKYFDWHYYKKSIKELNIANKVNKNILKILSKKDPYERKMFFIIDSRSLESVKTSFYGYSFSDEYVLENTNYNESIKLNKLGCYVAVNRYKSKITIEQDILGSFGLYLFKYKDIFIISNSFKILVEYIKTQFKITLNEDNMYYFLSTDIVPYCVTTLINEITLLDKEIFITIDIPSKELELHYIDNQELTIPVSSKQGVELLDKWLEKWINIFRFIYSQTDHLSIDLTAGFDTRTVFAIWLNSGIDLNRINIVSHKKKGYPYDLDLKVATEITSLFNLTINKNKPHVDEIIFFSLEEGLQNADNILLGFHKQFNYNNIFHRQKHFRVSGGGGESLRESNLTSFLSKQISNVKYFNNSLAEKIKKSISVTMNFTFIKFFEVKENYKEQNIFAKKYLRYVEWRHHFGKQVLANYYGNTIYLNPLIDPDLYKLELTVNEVNYNDLLFALIFTRYKKELLKFKFNKVHSISNKTLEIANKINRLYPFDISKLNLKNYTKVLNSSNSIFKEETIHTSGNKNIRSKIFNEYINAKITSKPYKDLIEKYFGKEYYYYLINSRIKNHYPRNNNQTVYEIISIVLDVMDNRKKYKFE